MRKFLCALLALLLSESGQVSNGSTDEEQGESQDQVASQDDLQGTDEGTTQDVSGQSQNQDTEEQFIDPATLPAELKAHWKRMHSEYNKRLKSVRDLKNKAADYDRFYGDPQFANQVLHEWASRNGFQLTRGGQPVQQHGQQLQQAQQQQQNAGAAPAALVEQFKRTLPPEMQWMAESQANAFWAAQQMLMEPLQKQAHDKTIAERNAEYDALEAELDELNPEWADHEDDMAALLDFMSGPNMRHKTFGSKLQILYNIITGNATAVTEAGKRFGKSLKNKNANNGQNVRTVPNLKERIRSAKKNEDAWSLAIQAAEADG